jgi:hypothetical protein
MGWAMKLDFDSGKNKEDPITKYGRIYAQFDKDALAKEQLKIDQQKVGMLQQQFATEQAANVSKLKAQGMLSDNPDISVVELASVHLPTATALQNIKASQATVKNLGKPKELTEAAYKRGIDTVLVMNKEYLQGTAGADYLNRMTNAYFGSETTGSLWWKDSLAKDLDTSSVDSVINFFNKNQDKLGLSKAAYNSTRKEILDGYKQAVREGAKALVHGGTKTTAPPSGGQDSNRTNTSADTFGVSQQSPLNPPPRQGATTNQQPSVSQALINIQSAIDETNTLEELYQLQSTVSERQKAVQVTPQQAAEVKAKFDKKSRELGR